MGHLSLEDIYPDEVREYGHMRVGMTDLYVKENHVTHGATTLGECRDLTRRLLRDETVQMMISAKLAGLPDDYDPWFWLIKRNRALRAKYGGDLILGETIDSPTSIYKWSASSRNF